MVEFRNNKDEQHVVPTLKELNSIKYNKKKQERDYF